MAAGSIIPTTDMYGCRVRGADFVLMVRVGTGYIPRMDGRGYPIIHGVGRHSIMGTGFMTIPMGGCGCRAMSGLLPG